MRPNNGSGPGVATVEEALRLTSKGLAPCSNSWPLPVGGKEKILLDDWLPKPNESIWFLKFVLGLKVPPFTEESMAQTMLSKVVYVPLFDAAPEIVKEASVIQVGKL